MRTIRMRWILGVLLPVTMAVVIGCNQEDWNWSGRSKTASNRRAGTKARRRVTPSAERSAVAKSDRPANDGEDAKAQEVERRVAAHYSGNRTSDYDSTYYGDELSAKIDRHSDPERKQRIRRTATSAYEPDDAAEPGASEGPSGTSPDDARRNARPPSSGGSPGEATPTVASNTQSGHSKPPAGVGEDSDAMAPTTPDAQVDDIIARPEEQSGEGPPSERAQTRRVALRDNEAGREAPPTATVREPETRANAAIIEEDKAERAASPQTKPPALRNISVSAGAEPEPAPSRKSEPATPTPNVARSAPEGKDTYKQRIAELETSVAADPNNLEDQFRLRMLYLVDSRDDDALAPTPGMNEELAEIMQAHFRALAAARSETGRDAAQWANRQLESLEDLRELVRSRADLLVPKVVLCTSIDGYGLYEPIEPLEFPAGRRSRAVLYIEVDNYKSEKIESGPQQGMYRTVLTTRQSLLNADGKELWSHTDKNIEDVARERRRDFFLSSQVPVPDVLAVGEYVLKVEVEDVLAGKINSNSVKFNIVVRSVSAGRGFD